MLWESACIKCPQLLTGLTSQWFVSCSDSWVLPVSTITSVGAGVTAHLTPKRCTQEIKLGSSCGGCIFMAQAKGHFRIHSESPWPVQAVCGGSGCFRDMGGGCETGSGGVVPIPHYANPIGPCFLLLYSLLCIIIPASRTPKLILSRWYPCTSHASDPEPILPAP